MVLILSIGTVDRLWNAIVKVFCQSLPRVDQNISWEMCWQMLVRFPVASTIYMKLISKSCRIAPLSRGFASVLLSARYEFGIQRYVLWASRLAWRQFHDSLYELTLGRVRKPKKKEELALGLLVLVEMVERRGRKG